MFHVVTSKAHMPNSCFGGYNYYNVALVETFSWIPPKRIDIRDRQIKRIVYKQSKLFKGKTERSAFQTAYRQAVERCEELNHMANTSQGALRD